MIALINDDDREYYSHIFALMKDGARVLAVIFNDEENRFELSNVYESKYSQNRKVTIIDFDAEGMIEKDEINFTSFKATECLGYDWLLNNPKLLSDIERNRQVDGKYAQAAKGLNLSIDSYKWREVTNKAEADELLDIAGGFHDSYLIGMNYTGGSVSPEFVTKVQLAFELYSKCRLVLEFEGEVKVHYQFSSNLNYIYASSIVFYENNIYWVEDEDDCRPCDIDENSCYVCAKKLRWKIFKKDGRAKRE